MANKWYLQLTVLCMYMDNNLYIGHILNSTDSEVGVRMKDKLSSYVREYVRWRQDEIRIIFIS